MSVKAAEDCYVQGRRALSRGKAADAIVLFETAMSIEGRRTAKRRNMRYLSYYGLSMAEAQKPTPEAIEACEVAARIDFFDPTMHLNLGKVYMLAGRRNHARAAFARGLRLAPESELLRDELGKIERRKSPMLPWFSRTNPINRMLGKTRFVLTGGARRMAD